MIWSSPLRWTREWSQYGQHHWDERVSGHDMVSTTEYERVSGHEMVSTTDEMSVWVGMTWSAPLRWARDEWLSWHGHHHYWDERVSGHDMNSTTEMGAWVVTIWIAPLRWTRGWSWYGQHHWVWTREWSWYSQSHWDDRVSGYGMVSPIIPIFPHFPPSIKPLSIIREISKWSSNSSSKK